MDSECELTLSFSTYTYTFNYFNILFYYKFIHSFFNRLTSTIFRCSSITNITSSGTQIFVYVGPYTSFFFFDPIHCNMNCQKHMHSDHRFLQLTNPHTQSIDRGFLRSYWKLNDAKLHRMHTIQEAIRNTQSIGFSIRLIIDDKD
ncbi:uncharacterized protein LOC117152189 [Bombus impatiens]|uniref:Uncharacterized protein LOC117152189 n=1 Tax=Bombus impatiens TaxID=132113 RepID=A0A6P8LJ46_BOMIM|nr:uncharacterized protein LOC117152189 [Bombus impatiens]